MIGFYNYTVYMTFLGLVSSAYGLVMAATGHPLRALPLRRAQQGRGGLGLRARRRHGGIRIGLRRTAAPEGDGGCGQTAAGGTPHAGGMARGICQKSFVCCAGRNPLLIRHG